MPIHINIKWNKDSIADLEFRLANDQLSDLAGYNSKGELYASVEAMGLSDDSEVRGYVMDILYRLDRQRAFSLLMRRLKDTHESIRAGAVELLGAYGERIVPFLIPVLHSDPAGSVRCCAAAMLGNFGTTDAIPPLKAAVATDNGIDFHGNSVREVAKHAIKQIKASSPL